MSFILCGAVGSVQNIDKNVYEKAADYVIGYYVKAYILKKINCDFFEKELKKNWKKLENNSFDNPISMSDLEQIINKLPTKHNNEDIHQKTTDFYNEIKEKRDKYNDTLTKQKVIEKLTKLPSKYFEDWQNKEGKLRFQEQYDALNLELKEKLTENSPASKKDNSVKSERKSGTKDKDKKSPSHWLLWLVVGAIGGVVVWEKWLEKILSKFSPKKISAVAKSYHEENVELKEEKKELKKKIQDIEQENNELRKETEKRNMLLQQAPRKLQESQTVAVEQKTKMPIIETPQTSNSSVLYAASINDGYFNRVSETPNENTIFELHLQNTNMATFTIYEGAKQLVCKHPEFLEGCEKQVLTNAQNVKIESEGEAQKQPDGKWKIIKKLNVIIN
jgi:hypothetical protein